MEKRSGIFEEATLIDLPGIYQLIPETKDEQVAVKSILNSQEPLDGLIFIMNSIHFKQSMLLFSQLADLQIPMMMVLNFKDQADKRNIEIDLTKLKNQIGCPVVFTNARDDDRFDSLRTIIKNDALSIPQTFSRSSFDELINDEIKNTYKDWILNQIDPGTLSNNENKISLETDLSKRNRIIDGLIPEFYKSPIEEQYLDNTRKIDRYLAHPFWGAIFLTALLFLVFQILYKTAAYPMDWIDGFFGTLSTAASNLIGDNLLGSLVSDGIIPGLGGVLIFLPQIVLLFLFIAIFESSGYMARVAFLSDRLLSKFGLNGKSVVPLVSGIACSIPAIMAARTIKNEKERLLTILVTPFMTCAARLPVYAILIALIIPSMKLFGIIEVQGLVLLGLYLIGFFMALFASWVLNRFIRSDESSEWVLELPAYQWPKWNHVFYEVFRKAKTFILEAGKIIFIISIVLWVLSSFSPRSESFLNEQILKTEVAGMDKEANESSVRLEYSYAGYLGKIIEPAIAPLGYDWKIGIALLSSFAAREVFVGSLATIYAAGGDEEETVMEAMKNETLPNSNKPRFTFGVGLSLMLFYAFAMQCMSTLAIVKSETNSWKYPILQFIFMTAIAYIAALIAYQLF